MTLSEICEQWQQPARLMSKEELKSLLIENWGEIESSSPMIHDERTYELLNDREFLEVFQEVFQQSFERIRLILELPQLVLPVPIDVQSAMSTTRRFSSTPYEAARNRRAARVISNVDYAATEWSFLGQLGRLPEIVQVERPYRQISAAEVSEAFEHGAELHAAFRDEALLFDELTEQPNLSDYDEEYEIVARTAKTRSPKAVAKSAEPIYIWGLQSSKPRAGGNFITYEVRLEENGQLRCNCPGWIFKKNDAVRGCKHTREVEAEAKDFFKKYRAGEQLPTIMPSQEQTERLKASRKTEIGTFGRIIDFD